MTNVRSTNRFAQSRVWCAAHTLARKAGEAMAGGDLQHAVEGWARQPI
jgi:hypothetical protein